MTDTGDNTPWWQMPEEWAKLRKECDAATEHYNALRAVLEWVYAGQYIIIDPTDGSCYSITAVELEIDKKYQKDHPGREGVMFHMGYI